MPASHSTARSTTSTTLSLRGVTVTRGARPVLDSVDLVVAGGHRMGVVGPNGVGKSTLLAAAAAAVPLDAGEVRTTPPTATVGWLHQEPERIDESVRAALARRTGVTGAQRDLDDAATRANQPNGAVQGVSETPAQQRPPVACRTPSTPACPVEKRNIGPMRTVTTPSPTST